MLPAEQYCAYEAPDDDFERQFSHRKSLELAGGTAEVVDIKPERVKDAVPVFLAPGWGCDLSVYKKAIEALAQHEREVLSLSHPRQGDDLESHAERLAPDEAVRKYPTEELRKALNILSVLEQKGVKKTDAIAHSEAAINTTIAAVLHPEKFRNIVYFAPAGMIGKDTFSRLVKGFLGQLKRGNSIADMPITDTEKEVGAASLKSVGAYLAQNPLRALKEALAISDSQIHEMIRYLHEKGIGILVMSPVDDPVFPTRDMKKVAEMDAIDGFMTTRGGHRRLFEDPERNIGWVDKMLSALEAQRQKKLAGRPDADLSEEFI